MLSLGLPSYLSGSSFVFRVFERLSSLRDRLPRPPRQLPRHHSLLLRLWSYGLVERSDTIPFPTIHS